jgi:hypothetical protein
LWKDDRTEAAAALRIGDLVRGSRRWVLVATRAIARREYLGKATQGLFSLDREGASVSADCCRAAVAALARALDDRPDMIYHDLAEVVRCLVRLRIELTAARREGEPGDRLERCNAILSMVIGCEYPLAGIRRDRLQRARVELASLIGER